MHKEDTKSKLLSTAKQEFLAYGYQKASLRRICKEAGVTTGALYFFFKDKEALYDTLVEGVAEQVMTMLKEHTNHEEVQYSNHHSLDQEYDIGFAKTLISYYYAHQDVGDLLLSCSQGSKYEHYADGLIHYMEERNKIILQHMLHGENVIFNECTIHWLSHMQVEAFTHVLSHHFSEEQALQQIEIVVTFLRGGFDKLFQKTQEV